MTTKNFLGCLKLRAKDWICFIDKMPYEFPRLLAMEKMVPINSCCLSLLNKNHDQKIIGNSWVKDSPRFTEAVRNSSASTMTITSGRFSNTITQIQIGSIFLLINALTFRLSSPLKVGPLMQDGRKNLKLFMLNCRRSSPLKNLLSFTVTCGAEI